MSQCAIIGCDSPSAATVTMNGTQRRMCLGCAEFEFSWAEFRSNDYERMPEIPQEDIDSLFADIRRNQKEEN